jgi:hypothetical protein
MISQLYNSDRSFNLLEENGGSAVQLSLYLYDITPGNPCGCFPATGCSTLPGLHAAQAGLYARQVIRCQGRCTW